MTSNNRGRTVLASVAGVAAVVAAAVAIPALSGSGDDGERQVVTAAGVADATTSVDSARMRAVVGAGENVSTNEGVVDFAQGATEVVTSAFSIIGQEATMRYRWVDGEVFVQHEDETQRWVRLTDMDATGQFDPSVETITELLGGSPAALREVGTDELRGVPTTTYVLPVDADDFIDGFQLPPGSENAKIRIDIDAEQRLRKAVLQVDAEADPPSSEPELDEPAVIDRWELEFWDFGIDVDIPVPDEADVVELDDPASSTIMFGTPSLDPADIPLDGVPLGDPPPFGDLGDRPTLGDHWHAAYAVYVCGEFVDVAEEYETQFGIHSHGDSVIHIHPFDGSAAGDLATLGRFVDGSNVESHPDGGASRIELTDTTLTVDGRRYSNGDSCGAEGPGEVIVATWRDAAEVEGPPETHTTDLQDVRFERDGEAYTIAFAPPGSVVPPPPSAQDLTELSAADPLG